MPVLLEQLPFARTRDAVREIQELAKMRVLQIVALTVFLVGVGTEGFLTKYCVRDLDVWWHLKVGDWIVTQHAFPHTGIFSQTAADRPWRAYSWGYEVLLSRFYALFGFLGMGLFGVALTIAVAGVTFWMLHRLSRRFWTAWVLSIVACYGFLFNLMPRPVFFSMMLLMVVLTAILDAQRQGRSQLLYWLPLVFLLWANLHIQFIYGLFVLGLFVGINLLQNFASRLRIAPSGFLEPALQPGILVGVFAASVLATCIGPYSVQLYRVIFEYATASFPYTRIVEFQSLNFATLRHYVVVVLAAAGFLAVGWNRKIDLFKIALLTIASVVAFRTTRDSWFICIPAIAFIADLPADKEAARPRDNWLQHVTVAVAVLAALFLIARNTDFSARGLDRAVSAEFPVDAVNYLRKHPLPGPVYNSFNWGGFLIWYMPQYPVAIDGRTDLYGDQLDELFFRSELADPSYTQDRFLNSAGFILLRDDVPLANALRIDPRFRMVYRDAISVVYVRQ